jgi:non-specific serine/threonine protein kinase
MRHAIAWSYDLLSPDEQQLFRRLSVFIGGFTLEGAEAIGANDAVLDLLTSLVDKSLVRQVEPSNRETRFSMLEAVREFTLEQLAESGEMEAVRDDHAAAFVALAEAALPHYGDNRWLEWMDKMEAALPNCHAALEWADTNGDAETVARLAGALWRPEYARGNPSDGGRWLERALAMRDSVSPAALTEVLDGAACYYTFLVDDSARAQALSTELIAHADALGDASAAGDGHTFLGMLALRRPNYAEASAHFRQALALAAVGRSPAAQIADAIFNLARLAFHQGDLEAAADGYADALARNREIGFAWGIQEALGQLGQVRLAQGNTEDAAALMAEELGLAWDLRETGGMAHSLDDLAVVAIATGQIREAAQLIGAVGALRLRYGMNPELSCSADAKQAALQARQILGDAAFDAAHAAGEMMSLEEATQVAFAVAKTAQTGSLPPASAAGHGLTSREIDVLRLLVEGQSDKEIAEALGITRRTASKHVETIRGKFGVSSRTAAAAYAARHGLI